MSPEALAALKAARLADAPRAGGFDWCVRAKRPGVCRHYMRRTFASVIATVRALRRDGWQVSVRPTVRFFFGES